MRNLPLCKGEPCSPKEGSITCTIHSCPALETDWRPQEGLDPQLREYQCTAHGIPHAIYKHKAPREARGKLKDPASLAASFPCLICDKFLPSKKALEEHILEKHSKEEALK